MGQGHLAVSEEGQKLIRSARIELRTINHLEIEVTLSEVVGSTIIRSYYDLSVEVAEQIEIYVLGENVEKRLLAGR